MNEQVSFTLRGRNPDVLTCIANLSNDEVLTPPELAGRMLDLLLSHENIEPPCRSKIERGRVNFFFKLPSKFKIATPLGDHNPDWAVVFEDDARVYFVAETKSSTVEAARRSSENLKIQCGRKHFGLAADGGIVFQ